MSGLATMMSNVRTALRTRLWSVSGIPAAPYRKLENVEFDLRTVIDQTWVREQTRFGAWTPQLVGGNTGVQLYECSGSYMVDLFYPKFKSTTASDTLTAAVRNAFAGGVSLPAGDVSVFIIRNTCPGEIEDKDGWYFHPIFIEWRTHIAQ